MLRLLNVRGLNPLRHRLTVHSPLALALGYRGVRRVYDGLPVYYVLYGIPQ